MRARAIQPPPNACAENGRERKTRKSPAISKSIARRAWAEIQRASDVAATVPAPSPMPLSSISRGRSERTRGGTRLSTSALADGLTSCAAIAEVEETQELISSSVISRGTAGKVEARAATTREIHRASINGTCEGAGVCGIRTRRGVRDGMIVQGLPGHSHA